MRSARVSIYKVRSGGLEGVSACNYRELNGQQYGPLNQTPRLIVSKYTGRAAMSNNRKVEGQDRSVAHF